jgi:hypothetical protein
MYALKNDPYSHAMSLTLVTPDPISFIGPARTAIATAALLYWSCFASSLESRPAVRSAKETETAENVPAYPVYLIDRARSYRDWTKNCWRKKMIIKTRIGERSIPPV